MLSLRCLLVSLSFLSLLNQGRGAATPKVDIVKRAASDFFQTEVPISQAGVLANIGPRGGGAQGARAGVVVASPSRSNPDYFYSWTRDTSLVFASLIERFAAGDTSLETYIRDFVTSTSNIQRISNPSGTLTTGGLGEPKFNADETAFTGAWGRPQRDGPALRAIALMSYGNAIFSAQASYVTGTIWPLVQNDLGYVVTYWNNTGFDLWEEVSGSSFFTIAVSHQALRTGYTFSTLMGSTQATYQTTAQNVLCFLQYFWSGSQITANINVNNGRSGRDANSILGSIHTFDPADLTCNAYTFQPCSDRALAGHKVVVDSFRSIYAINSGLAAGTAAAVGRYPEDSYYGGNPWYLNTLAAAEQLYDALYTWDAAGRLNVTSVSLPFFTDFSSTAAVGSYARGSSIYTALTAAIQTYADGFVAIAQRYTPSAGSLAEQYSRSTGAPLSAADLTWSYASVLTSSARRSRSPLPRSWGSSGLASSGTCGNSGGGGGSGGSGPISGDFRVTATTTNGQEIYVTGNQAALGNWDPSSGTHLPTSSSTYPLWQGTVSRLPASTVVEYKYVRRNTDGTWTWETGSNRVYTTPSSGSFTVTDTFRT